MSRPVSTEKSQGERQHKSRSTENNNKELYNKNGLNQRVSMSNYYTQKRRIFLLYYIDRCILLRVWHNTITTTQRPFLFTLFFSFLFLCVIFNSSRLLLFLLNATMDQLRIPHCAAVACTLQNSIDVRHIRKQKRCLRQYTRCIAMNNTRHYNDYYYTLATPQSRSTDELNSSSSLSCYYILLFYFLFVVLFSCSFLFFFCCFSSSSSLPSSLIGRQSKD